MLYDVQLTISYEYDAPTDHARNLLRLLPSDIGGKQRVLSRLLTADPAPSERRDVVDFFGNAMTTMVWHEPIEAVTFDLRARIERFPVSRGFDISSPMGGLAEDLTGTRSIGGFAPHHFVQGSRRAGPNPAMTAYARDQIEFARSTLEVVEAVGRALHRDMKFDAEATTVDTPAEEAFAKRHGVCQDFTHVMISCLRGLGVPAGYVSGFLRTIPPPGRPRLEGADAMHAWVRAWVGAEMGWVEFDPTNDIFAGVDHIAVAYGRDYDDVPPVRGAMRGSGGQDSSQAVDVIPVG